MNERPKPTPPIEYMKKNPKMLQLEDLMTASDITALREKEAEKAAKDKFNKAVEEEFLRQSQRYDLSTLFEIRKASEWIDIAATRPNPRMLFDSLWFEGDLCILFADTNVGKSILAVQIGDSISRGQAIPGFEMTAPAQLVAYFDFELSAKQFQARYTHDFGRPYPFAETFYRAELDMSDDYIERGYKTFEAYMYDQLEHYIQVTNVKVMIIDNITYLRSETEQAKDASVLMRMLNALKRKYGISMLVLAHTPKRDQSRPIEANHLQGSKVIANLCDAIITIGKSYKDNNLRYIKQLKGRLAEKAYEEDNVCVCQITKPDDFLHFELIGYGMERDHLKESSDKDLGQRKAAVKDLAAEGKSQREIARQLGISISTVNKHLKV